MSEDSSVYKIFKLKAQDLSSTLESRIRNLRYGGVYLQSQHQGSGDRQIPGARCWPASLPKWAISRSVRDCLRKRNWSVEGTRGTTSELPLASMPVYIHMCTYTQAHTDLF